MLYLIFMISIFIHELSHIIIGVLLKCKVKKIRILPIGFFIEFQNLCNKNFYKKLLIFLIGPISNIGIGLYFRNLDCMFSKEICLINFSLGIVNLFPVYPLDGENITEIILKKIYGYKRGMIYSLCLSKSFLCGITFLYSLLILKIKNLSIFIFIVFLWGKNFEKEKYMKLEKNAYKVIEKTLF